MQYSPEFLEKVRIAEEYLLSKRFNNPPLDLSAFEPQKALYRLMIQANIGLDDRCVDVFGLLDDPNYIPDSDFPFTKVEMKEALIIALNKKKAWDKFLVLNELNYE